MNSLKCPKSWSLSPRLTKLFPVYQNIIWTIILWDDQSSHRPIIPQFNIEDCQISCNHHILWSDFNSIQIVCNLHLDIFCNCGAFAGKRWESQGPHGNAFPISSFFFYHFFLSFTLSFVQCTNKKPKN